ncbi:hypothetical protein OPV22_024787 [Ensete ventricosum]|uniref:glutathione transferase n=1 Tax=Ensete ventricosum TaxID=4639 RepID=A0AAV8Q208_ENSVE|nr:hypothetical protein OPV22_024787 [Ensete ventricosum]
MAAPVPPVAQVYYGRPMLPDVSRVLTCLYEKDITFELVDMYKGHTMPADILKLQATMRAPVPAFEDRHTFLLESRAICRYVSEKYAEHGNKYLLGRDMLDRGSIEQWLKTEEQSFNPPSWALVFHLAFAPLTNGNELEPSLVTENEKVLGRVLDVYEHRLRESEYLAGDEFTLADLCHLPNSHYLVNSSQWNHLFNSRKNIQRWWEKISNRPSWTKVVEMLNEKVKAPNKSSSSSSVVAEAEVATAREAKISHPSQTPAAAPASQTSPPAVKKSSPQTAAVPASQTSPAPEPGSKPSLEQNKSKSSADKPDSAIDQHSSPEGPASKPVSQSQPAATQPTPQSQQGDSSTGKSTSVTTPSNQKTDTPIDNSAPKGTSETKATNQPDSTASSTASDKPNSQPSGDKAAS